MTKHNELEQKLIDDHNAVIQESKECKKVYEVVDVSNDEIYFTIGVFFQKEKAISGLKETEDPTDFDSDGFAGDEEFFAAEVWERSIGWGSGHKIVFRISWTSYYDEEKDEYLWRVNE